MALRTRDNDEGIPAELTASVRAVLGKERQSLSERTYDRLLDLLLSRQIPVGTVLQERRLAEMLEVSRTPTREALYRLESEGFVTRKPGRMLTVREVSVRDLIEILHVRRVLETESVSLALGRIPPEELDDMEAAIIDLLASDDPSTGNDWQVDDRFHGMIGQYSGNSVLAKTIQDLRMRTHLFDRERVPERFIAGHREHLAILAALREKDLESARQGIQLHIDNVKTSIIRTLSEI